MEIKMTNTHNILNADQLPSVISDSSIDESGKCYKWLCDVSGGQGRRRLL